MTGKILRRRREISLRNQRALARWYPHLLDVLPRRAPADTPPPRPARLRASLRGRTIPLARALRAPALVAVAIDPVPLARLMARRPPGSRTLVVEPDAARFRAMLERRDMTGLLSQRGLRVAVGNDPLKLAAAALALPAWTEPAVIAPAGGAGEDGAVACALRVVEGALSLSRAQREVPARELARWTRAIRRRPESLLRLPLALTP